MNRLTSFSFFFYKFGKLDKKKQTHFGCEEAIQDFFYFSKDRSLRQRVEIWNVSRSAVFYHFLFEKRTPRPVLLSVVLSFFITGSSVLKGFFCLR